MSGGAQSAVSGQAAATDMPQAVVAGKMGLLMTKVLYVRRLATVISTIAVVVGMSDLY